MGHRVGYWGGHSQILCRGRARSDGAEVLLPLPGGAGSLQKVKGAALTSPGPNLGDSRLLLRVTPALSLGLLVTVGAGLPLILP